MHVRRLVPFGARVSGLEPDAFASHRDDVVELLNTHGLVVFEGLPLTVEQHVELVSWVGPVLDEGMQGAFHSHIRHDPSQAPMIAAEGVFVGPLSFHSDLTYTSDPPQVLSLQALELPGTGGETRFASGVRALGALPASLRDLVEGRVARHVFNAAIDEYGGHYREDALGTRYFAAEHPIVRRNPRTGRDVLFVNELLTDSIVGVTRAEGDALLAELFTRLSAPDNVYVHHWTPFDLVLWENLEVQHARSDFDRSRRRVLRRVIAGDAGANRRHGAEFHAQLQGVQGHGAVML
jgi:taurine dioxygenase